MLKYSEYFDKVYGCWLGKCVVGTVGAPYEGMKQLLDLRFDDKMIETMLPNDDLDLQVLWLSVLEEKGIYVSGEDLAKAFHEKNIYWPGEYAWFDRNYQRGIRPPYTGIYENDFYKEGMGCPIRAEIWGLIFPGNPALAAKICTMDATLDHNGNSVYFEQFWAAMIAQAFVEKDINKLIECGLKYIPRASRAACLIRDVVKWCKGPEDFRFIRSRIIAVYGHCDCTNSFQNIGITLMLLLRFADDVRTLAVTACNCGFDTDCTAGNAGALIGLLKGAKFLQEQSGFRDSGYVLTLNYKRRGDKLIDLAEDTARVALHFLNNYPKAINILTEVPEDIKFVPKTKEPALRITNYYDEEPYIAPGEQVCVGFDAESQGPVGDCLLKMTAPDGFDVNLSSDTVVCGGGIKAAFTATISMRKNIRIVNEVNLFTISAKKGAERAQCTFGLIGKTVYRIFGPFWENNAEIDISKVNGPYGNWFNAENESDFADYLRFYHLNMKTDPEREYMSVKEIENEEPDVLCYERNGRNIYIKGDVFHVKDITPFRGPCTVYLKRVINLEEDRKFRVHIGYSDAFRLYVNGELVRSRTEPMNWTPENVHIIPLQLKKGKNILIFKVCNRNGGDKYSITFLENRDCPPQTANLNSVLQED